MNKHAKRSAAFKRPGRRSQGVAASPATVQYTVRNIPAHVDKALRRKAREGRKSLNEVLRDALMRDVEGAGPSARVYTDLDALAGTWVDVPDFDEAIQAQDRVDESLWR
jgi:plasmid stability protein